MHALRRIGVTVTASFCEINDRDPVVLLSKIQRCSASSHGGYGDLICTKTYGSRTSSWFSDPLGCGNVHVTVPYGRPARCAKLPSLSLWSSYETGKQNGRCARHFTQVTNKPRNTHTPRFPRRASPPEKRVPTHHERRERDLSANHRETSNPIDAQIARRLNKLPSKGFSALNLLSWVLQTMYRTCCYTPPSLPTRFV